MRQQPPITAAQTEFLAALTAWSDRGAPQVPSACPPCNALGIPSEDRILSAVFEAIIPMQDDDRIGHVARITRLHMRTLSAWRELGIHPVEHLIDRAETITVLSNWGEALRGVPA